MKFTTIHQLSVATAVGITFSFLATGEAQAYSFTKIADSSGPLQGFGRPAINNNGTVAFWTDVDMRVLPPGIPRDHSDYYTQQFIMSGNGGALTTIYDGYRFLPGLPYSTNNLNREPDINDEGTVAFKVYAHSARVNIYNHSGIFAGNGGTNTTIYPFWRYFSNENFSGLIPSNVGTPAINNQGTVVFSSCCEFYNGQFVPTLTSYNNGLLTTIAIADSRRNDITIPLVSLSNPTINDWGTISFNGVLKNGFSGIFTTNSGQFTTIADNSGIFNNFGKPAINNQGTLAFSALLDTGVSGIFTNNGGEITTIVDSTSPFAQFGDVAIDNKGNLVFGASLDAGGIGIFTGSNPVANKVIATGDVLFGSKVKYFAWGVNGFRREGFNDVGQIAFFAALEDGTQGIYRADPDPEPPKSIPEPTSVLGLFTAGALALVKRRKS
ncbi:PEP-CTERM sorting domain-containing protein [Limnofasciculus baicalensis]|uniref:PEP-CTERM sorting domain-containing protein n=1 Tax=Limnofasciculus baicalensis BBK-W-15 TaxID=2699891 RepID=A0AAE3GSY0_9CYAN|nr:PEP-CTERM sorting domain-containing protein [Limnofasciculus baicalensis]MCP2727957.1 PEP-CTERM sorting domain-containing protein [Limnofasciculus baicalensis BBK-W-15]